MLTILALLLQTAPAPTPIDCGVAVVRANPTPNFAALDRITHLAMLAAGAEGEDDFFARVGPTTRTIRDKAGTAAPGVSLDACAAAFPTSWASSAAPLPAESFDRRMACFATGASIEGLTETFLKNNADPDGEVRRIHDAAGRFRSIVSEDDFAKHGVADPASARVTAMHALFVASGLGTPLTVFRACEAAFPA